jgi:hypothetical protein
MVLEVEVGGSPRPAVEAGKESSSTGFVCSQLAVVAGGVPGFRVCFFLQRRCRGCSWCCCFFFVLLPAAMEAVAGAAAGVSAMSGLFLQGASFRWLSVA